MSEQQDSKAKGVQVKITEQDLDRAAERIVDTAVEHIKNLACTCDAAVAQNKRFWLCIVHGIRRSE